MAGVEPATPSVVACSAYHRANAHGFTPSTFHRRRTGAWTSTREPAGPHDAPPHRCFHGVPGENRTLLCWLKASDPDHWTTGTRSSRRDSNPRHMNETTFRKRASLQNLTQTLSGASATFVVYPHPLLAFAKPRCAQQSRFASAFEVAGFMCLFRGPVGSNVFPELCLLSYGSKLRLSPRGARRPSASKLTWRSPF